MKFFIASFFIFVLLFCNAQNWVLFNSYDHYNFKQASSPLINSFCFVDSFKVSGSDTIYYVNRIVERKTPDNTGWYDTAELNRAQFLQKEIRRTTDGWYNFYNPGSIVLNAYAGLNDSWLYDTVRNITATVFKVDTMTIFNLADSIKYIALSDSSDTILISRSFGILQFPFDSSDRLQAYGEHFTLQGIETRGEGDSLINFRDVYDFNVGDVFYYTMQYIMSVPTENVFWKYTITSKIWESDSVKYGIHEIVATQNLPPMGPGSWYADNTTLIFKDSLFHVANSYPGQFVPFIYLYNGNLAFVSDNGMYDGNYYTMASYANDPVFGVRCKKIGGTNGWGVYDSIVNNEMYSGLNPSWLSPPLYQCLMCEGLGFTRCYSNAFEGFWYPVELSGYIKNGITYGTVASDFDLTGPSSGTDLNSQRAIILTYPTLVSDKLFVKVQNSTEVKSLHFWIFDVLGKLVFSEALTSAQIVNCAQLASGTYLWRVSHDENKI